MKGQRTEEQRSDKWKEMNRGTRKQSTGRFGGRPLKRKEVICVGSGLESNHLFKHMWVCQLGLTKKEVLCMGREPKREEVTCMGRGLERHDLFQNAWIW